MPYSVSPRWVLQTVGPKPMKYWVTLPPNAFAGTMWPSSCSPIEARIASTNSRAPAVHSTESTVLPASLVRRYHLCRPPPGPLVRVDDVLDGE